VVLLLLIINQGHAAVGFAMHFPRHSLPAFGSSPNRSKCWVCILNYTYKQRHQTKCQGRKKEEKKSMFLSTRSFLSLLLTGSLALASGSTAPRRGFAGLTIPRSQHDIPRGGVYVVVERMRKSTFAP